MARSWCSAPRGDDCSLNQSIRHSGLKKPVVDIGVAALIDLMLFADLSPQSTAGTGTHCGSRGLTRGAAAHRLACGSTRRTACSTTDNGSGLTLPLRRYGSARSAANRAANHSACIAANLLADGGPGSASKRTAKGGLAC
jgi:hypothetical protein